MLVLLKFMLIPIVAASVFTFYNLFNYDVWLDKRTPLSHQERMSKEFRAKPRYLVSAATLPDHGECSHATW